MFLVTVPGVKETRIERHWDTAEGRRRTQTLSFRRQRRKTSVGSWGLAKAFVALGHARAVGLQTRTIGASRRHPAGKWISECGLPAATGRLQPTGILGAGRMPAAVMLHVSHVLHHLALMPPARSGAARGRDEIGPIIFERRGMPGSHRGGRNLRLRRQPCRFPALRPVRRGGEAHGHKLIADCAIRISE